MRNQSGWWRVLVLLLGASLVSACTTPPPKPREPSAGHIATTHAAPPVIPQPVMQAPILPAPKATPRAETYTVVVDNVPVRELLFALARDAKRDVDIHPGITGNVTLNAIDQTLPQILDRLSRLIDLRYQIQNKALLITPDRPYLKTYTVDYVNMSRDTEGSVSVATQIATTGSDSEGGGGGGGNNNSATEVSSSSKHHFWETLATSLRQILAATVNPLSGNDDVEIDEGMVIPNPESGVIAISATERQHAKVQDYLDKVLGSVRRQVMMEATIVEVELNDAYQSGIDFEVLAGAASSLVLGPGGIPGTAFATAIFDNTDKAGEKQDFSLTVRLLKEFGDVRVLSSPKIMVLNNQTAIFKVVENLVFFSVETETVPVDGAPPIINTTTTAHTVPVGLVMAITPQISASDEIVLNVRPTITRSDTTVADPNPDLGAVANLIPVIQVREMESMLRLQSSQIAVLGGLMQDSVRKDTGGLPVLSEQDGPVGELFKSRDNDFTKTELVIFLRPTVIRSPSVSGDLTNFQRFLPENLKSAKPQTGLPKEQSK